MLRAQDLTAAERLLIERRRAGETKEEAAAAYGVSAYRYNRWEAGHDVDTAPAPALGRLAFFEGSFLQRRRDGVSLAEFAELVGVSRWWLTQMEVGAVADDRLREHRAKDGRVQERDRESAAAGDLERLLAEPPGA